MKTFVDIFRAVGTVAQRIAGGQPTKVGAVPTNVTQHTPAAITPATPTSSVTAPLTLTASVGPGRPSTSEVREPHVAYQTKGTTPDIPPPRRWDVAEGIEQLQKSGLKHEQSLAIIKQISASHNELLYAIGQLRDDMHSMMWKMLAYQAVLMTALLTIFATIMLVAIKL